MSGAPPPTPSAAKAKARRAGMAEVLRALRGILTKWVQRVWTAAPGKDKLAS